MTANVARYRASMLEAGRITNQQLAGIRKDVASTSQSFQTFNRALGGFVGFQALKRATVDLSRVADQFANIQARIRLAVGETENLNASMGEVFKISQRTYSSFDSTATLVARTTRALVSNGEASEVAFRKSLRLSEAINNAFLVSGATSQESQNAIIQLSQGLAAGALRGEEYNSVAEQGSRITQALAEHLKVTTGQLREMAKDGKLTADVVTGALLASFGKLQEEAGNIPLTIGRAKTQLDNAFTTFIGEADQASGASRAVAASMSSLADNLKPVVDTLGLAAVAATSLGAVKLSNSTADWVRGLVASQKALESQALAARAAAAEQVKRSALEAQFAVMEAEKARRTGGLILLEREATIARSAHEAAVRRLDAAEKQLAATQSLTRRAGSAVLGLFGGPVGLAAMVATTAASWLIFRNNTQEAQQALVEWSGAADQAIAKFYELNKAQQSGAILQLQQQIEERRRELSEILRNMAMVGGPDENIISERDYKLAVQYAEAMRQLEAQWSAGKLSADELSNRVDALNKQIIGGSESSRYFASYLTEQGAALGSTSREAQSLQSQLDTITGKQHAAGNAALAHANGLRTLSNAASSMDWKGLDGWLEKQREAAGARYSQAALGEVGALREQFEQQLLKDQAYTNATREQVAARRAEWNAIQSTMEATKALEEAKKSEAKAASAAARANDDAAQGVLRAAQARQQEYKLELAAGDSLSASRRELLKFELELRDTKDKYLKAAAGTIRAVLQENIALEDQIDATRRLHEAKLRSLAVDRQIADYRNSMQQGHQRDLDAIRFGGNTARWNQIAGGIGDDFRQQRLGIDREMQDRLATIPLEQMARRNEEQQKYFELLGKTVIAEAEALGQARKNYEEVLEAQANWINGLRSGIEDYIAAAQDMAGQTREIVGNIFSGAED
ncbi:MAG: tape measure protein, partial [Proteobacteria bacterium]|nr:tape measure protein [Pseudomonadota bacterium]